MSVIDAGPVSSYVLPMCAAGSASIAAAASPTSLPAIGEVLPSPNGSWRRHRDALRGEREEQAVEEARRPQVHDRQAGLAQHLLGEPMLLLL